MSETIIREVLFWLLFLASFLPYVIGFWFMYWLWGKVVSMFSYSKQTVETFRDNSVEQTRCLQKMSYTPNPLDALDVPEDMNAYRDRLAANKLLRDLDDK